MDYNSILLWCTLPSVVILVAVFLEEDIHLEHNADHFEENFIPIVQEIAVVSDVYSASAANFGLVTSNTNFHDSVNLGRQCDGTGSRCLVHHIVLTIILVIIFCDVFLMTAFTTIALKLWRI